MKKNHEITIVPSPQGDGIYVDGVFAASFDDDLTNAMRAIARKIPGLTVSLVISGRVDDSEPWPRSIDELPALRRAES